MIPAVRATISSARAVRHKLSSFTHHCLTHPLPSKQLPVARHMAVVTDTTGLQSLPATIDVTVLVLIP